MSGYRRPPLCGKIRCKGSTSGRNPCLKYLNAFRQYELRTIFDFLDQQAIESRKVKRTLKGLHITLHTASFHRVGTSADTASALSDKTRAGD